MTTAKGTWSDHQIAGHACQVYEPRACHVHGFTVVYLHGVHLAHLRDHAAFMRQFDKHQLRVVCPVTGQSWWTDRVSLDFDPQLTAERYVMDHVLPYVSEKWPSPSPRWALLGTSMGGQGALRFAFKYPNVFPVVAAISPAIDYQTRWEDGDEVLEAMYEDAEAARQDTAILYVHPLNWPRHLWFCCDPTDVRWHPSADRLRMKLAALGIPHDCDLDTESGGHGFEYYNAMAETAIEFIVEQLEQERMRLV